METKEQIELNLQAYSDTSGDLDLRASLGTPGYRIQVRNETQATGQSWFSPSFLRGIIQAIAQVIDGNIVSNYELVVETQSASIVLPVLPRANANYASGYQMSVFRAGVYSRYVTSLVNVNEYSFNPSTKTISFTPPLAATVFTVLYSV